jgi:hypothetical protein
MGNIQEPGIGKGRMAGRKGEIFRPKTKVHWLMNFVSNAVAGVKLVDCQYFRRLYVQ